MQKNEGMMIDADEAFDTRAAKRTHNPDESKRGEKDKVESKKKSSTWFGWTSGVETKSDQDCTFDCSNLRNHAMT